MNARNDVDTRIDRMCMLHGIPTDDVYVLGKSMLTLFRDVFSSTMLDADDMYEKLCSDFDEIDENRRMSEALTRLQFFATEGMRIRYEKEIDDILQTGWLLHVMEALKIKVYNFPDYGPDFVAKTDRAGILRADQRIALHESGQQQIPAEEREVKIKLHVYLRRLTGVVY